MTIYFRKILKQTYERKVNDLKARVKALEDENLKKDQELESLDLQISDAQAKLTAKRQSKISKITPESSYVDNNHAIDEN